MHIPVSVVIHTLNEEKNIKNCLESVKWADEIVVVDMFSEDKTVDIARQYTEAIFLHERCGGYADPARQFGLNQTTHEWVLAVDADELVPVTLKDQLLRLAADDACDIVYIPMQNYLFGQQMRGCGWGVDQVWHVRFFKKSCVHYSSQIHNYMSIIRPSTRALRLYGEGHALVHFNYIDFEHFLEKLNRYTTIEAKTAYLAGEKFNLEESWGKSISQIQDIAIHKGGYEKDGVYGLGLGLLMALYHFTCALKLKSMQEYNTTEPGGVIRERYQAIAEQLLSEYGDER